MKVISEKMKGPKHFDHDKGEYVPGRRTLNRVQCVQVPIKERKFVNVPVD